MINNGKRLKELYVILLYLSEEDFNKIPNELINSIIQNMDKSYEFDLDMSKPLDKQGIPEETLALLAYINTEYLLNKEQKELMKKIYRLNS